MGKQISALAVLCFASAGALFAGCSSSVPREVAQAKPAPPLIEFLGVWGTKGQGPGLLSNPRSIATDEFANVYIPDVGTPGRFVHKFSRDGHPLFSFEPLAVLRDPCATAVDSGGAIYVLECSAGAIYTFLPDGTFLHGIRGGLVASAKPSSLAVDDNGRIYVGETHARRVLSYTAQGRFLGALQGRDAKPVTPINADEVAAGAEGSLYVGDSSRSWIGRVSSDGTVQNSWTVNVNSTPSDETLHIISASTKYVAVMTGSASAPVLHIFTPDGAEKLAKPLQDVDPSIGAITVLGFAAAPDGELFVLDSSAPRVLRFRVNM